MQKCQEAVCSAGLWAPLQSTQCSGRVLLRGGCIPSQLHVGALESAARSSREAAIAAPPACRSLNSRCRSARSSWEAVSISVKQALQTSIYTEDSQLAHATQLGWLQGHYHYKQSSPPLGDFSQNAQLSHPHAAPRLAVASTRCQAPRHRRVPLRLQRKHSTRGLGRAANRVRGGWWVGGHTGAA